jgi:hypothetical protein
MAMTTEARIQRVLPLHYHEHFLNQPAAVTNRLLQERPAARERPHQPPLTEADFLVEEYLERSPFKGSLLEFATGLTLFFERELVEECIERSVFRGSLLEL